MGEAWAMMAGVAIVMVEKVMEYDDGLYTAMVRL